MIQGEALVLGGQAHLAVGEVFVVDQSQVVVDSGELGYLGARAVDVEGDVVGAGDGAVDKRIEAHGDAVGAHDVRFLHDGEGVLGDFRAQRGDTGGAQPLLGPAGQVAARGLLQRGE